MAEYDKREFLQRTVRFDRVCVAILLVVLLVLLAYNYEIFFKKAPVEGEGLLTRINESNVFLYVIVFMAGAFLFVRMHEVNLSEKIKITNASLLAILASFFIFASIFFFVAGFYDTFVSPSATPKEIRQTYGWVLEFILYAVIAYLLLTMSKKLKKTAERDFTVRVYSIGTILAIFIIIIFFIGFTICGTQCGVLRISVMDLVELLIFGGLAYFFIWTEESILRKQELTKENLYAPGIALALSCVVISVVAYAGTIIHYVNIGGGVEELFLSLIGSVVLGAIGVFLAIAVSLLFRPTTGQHILSPLLFLFGATYAIFSIVQLFIGLDNFLKSPEPNLRWLIAVVLFLLPAVLAYFIAPIVRRKSEEYFAEKTPRK
ncbi:MAG: hypothetical protein QXF56_05200 [Candidatus Micrarchaeia archaeon]